MSEIRFCKDCRHFTRDAQPARPQCGHLLNSHQRMDYVDGGEMSEPLYWQAIYLRISAHLCGPEARWFSPREAIGAESEKSLYADEEPEPRYTSYANEDERLDDPRHDQCRDGKFIP